MSKGQLQRWSPQGRLRGHNVKFLAMASNPTSPRPVADPENFGGGGFEAQNLKNSDVFTKIESDFSAEIGNSNVFFARTQVVSKKKKKRASPKLRLIFRRIRYV